MLLSLADLVQKYDIHIQGIVHVGAHLAEEAKEYQRLGVRAVYWIEGNPDNMDRITAAVQPYGHYAICALVTDKDREPTTFNITNYDSMSSSILEFGTHPTFSPETVFVDQRVYESRTLDSLARDYRNFSSANFLNMDLQGAELLALKGAKRLLPQIDYIYTEVNSVEVYKGCALIGELDAHLSNFERVETNWVGNQGWGDALYIRRK